MYHKDQHHNINLHVCKASIKVPSNKEAMLIANMDLLL